MATVRSTENLLTYYLPHDCQYIEALVLARWVIGLRQVCVNFCGLVRERGLEQLTAVGECERSVGGFSEAFLLQLQGQRRVRSNGSPVTDTVSNGRHVTHTSHITLMGTVRINI